MQGRREHLLHVQAGLWSFGQGMGVCGCPHRLIGLKGPKLDLFVAGRKEAHEAYFLFSPSEKGLAFWVALALDNVVYIVGSIPPLKLPPALSNHSHQDPCYHQH